MVRRQIIILLVVALVAGSVGYALSARLFGEPTAPAAGSATGVSQSVIGARRADYRHGDSNGRIITANAFDGQVVLVNFWATWCKPCREEMPMLSDLQKEFGEAGLQIVGIALDDVENAREFAQEIGIDYPILVGSTDVMVTVHNYGNRTGTLPYSVLVDRQGIVHWAHLGPLEHDMLVAKIKPLLGQGERGQSKGKGSE